MRQAALLGYGALQVLTRHTWPDGTRFARYLGLQGLPLLLPYGVRVAQVAGLGLVLVALVWLRAHVGAAQPPGEQTGGRLSESGA